MSRSDTDIVNVRLREDDQAVVIVDQTRLPNELVYLELTRPEERSEEHTV